MQTRASSTTVRRLREAIVKRAGPPLGFTEMSWLRLLAENRSAFEPGYWPKMVTTTAISAWNSVLARRESRHFGSMIQRTRVEAPLFILGHWRSGTTYLHHLMSLGEGFATPTVYEVMRPAIFLTTEERYTRLARRFSAGARRGSSLDGGFDVPAEDEFALMFLARVSPLLGLAFPRRWDHYQRHLTLRDVGPDERSRWQEAVVYYFKKIAFHYQKPLVLKSPPHTARLRLLLELFPDARFIHIRRHPYAVYRSTRSLYRGQLPFFHQLQNGEVPGLEDKIIRQYTDLHTAYFEQRALIPPGRLHELAYERLEQDPLGQIAAIYEGLGLPGFGALEPKLRAYIESIRNYQKNVHAPLEPAVQSRLRCEWERTFDEWGYDPGGEGEAA